MSHWFPYESYGSFHPVPTILDDPARQMQGRIALVGLPGAATKTLFNSLWGWEVVNNSLETIRSFGLFTLIDLPLDNYDTANVLYRLENADLIVYVLDGREGLTGECFSWIARLRSVEATLLIILDQIKDQPADEQAAAVKQIEERLARPVLPLVVSSKNDIQGKLIPAMLKVCPTLAVPLANEIPALRTHVARHVVLQTAVMCMSTGLDTGLANDYTTYMGIQTRMIRQIAAIYGYKSRDRYRERAGVSFLLRWMQRYGLMLSKQVTWLEAWMRPGLISAGTALIAGYLTILVYSGHLPHYLHRFAPIVGGNHDEAKRNGDV